MKKKIVIPAFATLISSALVAIITSSIAWFSNKVSVTTEDNLTGSSDGAYFAYGTGTALDDPTTVIKEGPFGIETPRQLYNLAWLQYLGYFNKDKDEDDVIDQQYYFELNADIDMTGWILPPIGTTLFPFIGNFNGRNFTITNLKISNDYQEIKNTNRMPSKVRRDANLSNVNIVGMFGVIGELDDNITAAYDSNIISVRDFTIAGAEIKNSLSKTLAGIAAGYVNGPLKNVAITSREGDTEQGESATMASRITTVGAENYDDYDEFDNISDYGVVGYCEPGFLDQVKNSVTETYNATSTTYDYIAQDKGEEAGWGGSMNMLDVYNGIKVKHWDDITSSTQKKRTSIPYKTSETYVYQQDGVTVDDYTYNETYSPDINKIRYYDRYDEDLEGYKNTSYSLLIETPESLRTDEWRFMCLTGYGPRTVNRGKTVTITSYYQDQTCYIHLDGDYLAADTSSGVYSVPSEEYAVSWVIKNNSIYTSINDTIYYLNGNYNDGLSISTTKTTNWTLDNGKISTTIDNKVYYLYCQDHDWFLGTTESEYKYYYSISGGNRYLNYNGSNLTAGTTDNDTHWYLDDSNRPYLNINGTPYYIRGNNNNASMGTSTNSAFARNGNYLQFTSSSFWSTTTYYVYVDGNNVRRTTSTSTRTAFTFTQKVDVIPPDIEVDPVLDIDNSSNKLRYTTSEVQDSVFYTPDTYIPLKTTYGDDGYRTGIADDTNTGYIVSGNEYTNDNYGDIRISAFELSSSLSAAGGANLSTVYTIDGNGRREVTSNAESGFSKFDDSKQTMVTEVLKENGTARDYVYGMHFMPASIGIADSNGHIVTVPKAKINGQTYYNYQLPHDCVDFNLKEKGYINFFGGTYYAGNVTHDNNSFFSLFRIERDPSTQIITTLQRIVGIYEDKSNESYSYIYRVQDTSTNAYSYTLPYTFQNGVKVYLEGASTSELYEGYESVFNSGWIERPADYGTWNNYAAYYYEIPMNDGEYALGSVEGMYGAYLMYLDIGANAKKVYRSEIIEYFKWIDKVYTYPRGVFVCAAGNTNASDQNSYCISLKESYTGTLIMDRTADEAKYNGSGDSTQEAIAYMYPHLLLKDENNDTKTIGDVTPDSTKTTEIKRLTFYDFNMKDSTLSKIVITDVIIDGDVANKTRTVEKYSNFNIETQTGTADDSVIIYIKNGDVTTKVTDPNTITFSTAANSTKILSFTTTYINGASITITFRLNVNGTENNGHIEYTPSGYEYTITLTRPDGTTEEITAYCYVEHYLNSYGGYTYTFKINNTNITGVTTDTPIEITVPAIPQNNPQNP